MSSEILFIGGDKRMRYAASAMSAEFDVYTMGLFENEQPTEKQFPAVVLPLPFMKNGKINAPFSEQVITLADVKKHIEKGGVLLSGMVSAELSEVCGNCTVIDYFADETLTLKNALFTAEGAVSLIIENIDISLFGADAIITGGGRIAMYLAEMLRNFGSKVTLCARNEIQRTKAQLMNINSADISDLPSLSKRADIIANTAPAKIFSEGDFSAMKNGAVYLELASLPAEPYKSFAEQNGVKFIYGSGLPGKMSPKSAGEAIAGTIENLLSQHRYGNNPTNTSKY